MTNYVCDGLDAAGKRICVPIAAEGAASALIASARVCGQVVQLHRLTEGPQPRQVPLLGEPNVPLPDSLTWSWTPLFDDGRRDACRRLAEQVRKGELQGEPGLLSVTVSTRSVVDYSMRSLRELAGRSVRPRRVSTSSFTPSPAPDLEVEGLLRELGERVGHPPDPPADTPIGCGRTGVLLEPIEAGFSAEDPPAIWRLSALLLDLAFTTVEGRRLDTLRVFPGPEGSRAERSRGGESPEIMEAPPSRLHAGLVTCLAAILGISPTSLPPQCGEVAIHLDGEEFILSGYTNVTEWGEEITVRCRPSIEGSQGCSVPLT